MLTTHRTLKLCNIGDADISALKACFDSIGRDNIVNL